jgi:hypothetical protein
MVQIMPKARKPKRKTTKKRGPKEERLVITDPQAALDKLLKKTPTR